MKSFDFALTFPHSNLHMACAVESVVSKLSQTWAWNAGEDQVHVREA
jgi:hypothetical protein